MNLSNHRKQNFLYGSVILMASTIIVKLIGCLFKIPLTNLIGSSGMGYFNTSYYLFNLVYALSVAGLPMAVARMVAKSCAIGNYKNVRKIQKISSMGFLITGLLGSLILLVFSGPYVVRAHNPDAYWCTVLMAPSIFFCCISSAYRGYYEGLQDMYPTAISQIIEAAIKLIIGYVLAWYIIKVGWQQYNETGKIFGKIVSEDLAENTIIKYSAAGAILGVTISTLFGSLYIWLRHVVKGDSISQQSLLQSPQADCAMNILKQLLQIAVPICLAAVVMNVSGFIDSQTMLKRLEIALNKNSDIVLSQYNGLIPSSMKIFRIPNFLFGAYSGMAVNIFNLVPSLVTSFSISILPAVTSAITKNDITELKKNMECVLRVTNLLAMPSALALIFLSKPILIALYGSRLQEAMIATRSLSLLGFASIMVALAMPINSMLQAIGKITVPAKLMIIGVIVKFILNQYLIPMPSININGAPIATIACYLIVFSFGLWILIKNTKISLNIKSVFIKPMIAAIICIMSAHLSFSILSRIKYIAQVKHGLLALMIAIVISCIIYLISLILLRAIEKNDILMLPKGKIFVKTLEKYDFLG